MQYQYRGSKDTAKKPNQIDQDSFNIEESHHEQ
jgi:hypothetical protein